MNNEIKEILDRLDFDEWEVDLYKVPITWAELYDIRDYINNLNNKQIKIENLCKELLKVNKFKSENKVLRMMEETYDDTLNTILDIIGE